MALPLFTFAAFWACKWSHSTGRSRSFFKKLVVGRHRIEEIYSKHAPFKLLWTKITSYCKKMARPLTCFLVCLQGGLALECIPQSKRCLCRFLRTIFLKNWTARPKRLKPREVWGFFCEALWPAHSPIRGIPLV
jgi:hypothetical protein